MPAAPAPASVSVQTSAPAPAPAVPVAPMAATPAPAAITPAPVASAPEPAPAPASEPAVAAEPKSEPAPEQPRERRTRTARSSGISMKAMMAEDPVAAPVVSKEEPAPSEEQIRAEWPKLAQKYADKPRLLAMLNSTTLEISGDDTSRTVVFEVLSQAQKDWVESKLLYDLEGNLRALLKTVKIYLRVSVKPDDAPHEKKIYMPSEQDGLLMQENAEVNNLIKDLHLDIK